MRKPLREGMKAGDLVDLVLPELSVDEYVSKVDPDHAVVIGFYVHDKEAANDLNRFVQKSAVDLLDTEVSPAPDQKGFYLVFVEFMNDERIGETVSDLLHEVSQLCSHEKWQMRIRSKGEAVPFSAKTLTSALSPDRDVAESTEILEFLRQSALCDVNLHEGHARLQSGGTDYAFQLVGMVEIKEFLLENGLADTPACSTLREAVECNRLTRALGAGWTATSVAGFVCLEKKDDSKALVLRFFDGPVPPGALRSRNR